MSKKQDLGKLGENLAVNYLVDRGYQIIERNHRQKWGDEIDIIAMSKSRILVFVEVKSMKSRRSDNADGIELQPEDNLSNFKLQKLRRVCQFYSNSHPELVTDRGWQVDLLAIDMLDNNLTDKSSYYEIRYYENI